MSIRNCRAQLRDLATNAQSQWERFWKLHPRAEAEYSESETTGIITRERNVGHIVEMT